MPRATPAQMGMSDANRPISTYRHGTIPIENQDFKIFFLGSRFINYLAEKFKKKHQKFPLENQLSEIPL